MDRQLFESITEDGVVHANFLNGHLLTAETLQAEQQAQARLNHFLGQALGPGIVRGLQVRQLEGESNSERVKVLPGLAINNLGQTLHLGTEVTLKLTKQSDGLSLVSDFAACNALAADEVYTGSGFYLLTMQLASSYQGKASLSGLPDEPVSPQCVRGRRVDGVSFRLINMTQDLYAVDAEDLNYAIKIPELVMVTELYPEETLYHYWLRSLVACTCIGTPVYYSSQLASKVNVASNDSIQLSYGVLPRVGELDDCEVPLAVLFWSDEGIRFVEMWAVRRLLMPASMGGWGLAPWGRRWAEHQALTLHQQEMLSKMAAAIDLGETGLSYFTPEFMFRMMPAMGVVPSQFLPEYFFAGFESPFPGDDGSDCVDEKQWRGALADAWRFEPLAIDGSDHRIIRRTLENGDIMYLYVPVPCMGEFFLTAEKPAEKPPVPPSEEQIVAAATGTAKVLVVESSERSTLRQMLARVVTKQLRVWVEDAQGKSYQGSRLDNIQTNALLKDMSAAGGNEGRIADLVRNPQSSFTLVGAFQFDNLPVGANILQTRQDTQISDSRSFSITENTISYVAVQLSTRQLDGGGLDPLPVNWIEPKWFKRGWMPWWKLEQLEEPPPRWLEFDSKGDVLPDTLVRAKLANRFKQRFPQQRLGSGDVTLHLAKDYVPQESKVRKAPYAYLKFGGNHIYMPVILSSFSSTNTLSNSGLGDVLKLSGGSELARRGLDRLEIIANSWSDLLAELLDVSVDNSGLLIEQAKKSVQRLHGGDGLQELSASSDVIERIEKAGYQDLVAVANANARELSERSGTTLVQSISFIESARVKVPEEKWAVNAAALGLNEDVVAEAERLGIKSQGQLQSELQRDDSAIAQSLGEQAESIATSVDDYQNQVQVTAASARPAYSLLEPQAAKQLAKAGYNTVGQVAGASAETIAVTAFAGDRVQADAAIAQAQLALEKGR